MSLREREVSRYYQPWLAAHGSSLSISSHLQSLAQIDLDKDGFTPVPSRDRALIAFAQLIAIRLDVRRCMVSLIERSTQHILAEATQTNSRSKPFGEDGDELWLGSTSLARADAICEHALVNTCTAREDDGRSYTATGLIINDLRLDSRFQDRPYVTAEPGVRFYAGVPLLSRTGHMIGTVACSTDEPRDGLTADELRYMQDTAQSVMEHLEWARDRVDRFKGERIVRGMATFIEDVVAVRNASATEKSRSISPTRAKSENGRPRTAKRLSSRQLPTAKALSKIEPISRMYASAADILRESMLADGCAIFGATAESGRKSSYQPLPGNMDGVTHKVTDSDRHDTGTSGTSDSDGSPTGRPCKTLAFSVADQHARLSIEDGSALTLGTLERYLAQFPLGRQFSFNDEGGKITSEEEGSASEASERETERVSLDENAKERPGRRRRRRMDHRELLKKIPGAKTVVFLPLYDHAEEKLLGGIFLWTSVVGRMVLEPDLSHLRAFGNCIVGEVIRINMQRNEAAKTTFIASMSHELRSPLHGTLLWLSSSREG